MAILEDKLQQLLTPVIESFGCELWGIEVIRAGKFLTLRIYIDKDGGVGVDDCADVSNLISSILDVEDLIQDKYNLEVSSPGIERRLFNLDQYNKYLGQELSLTLRLAQHDRRKWQGKLIEITGDLVHLELNYDNKTTTEQFVFSNILKANLVVSFGKVKI